MGLRMSHPKYGTRDVRPEQRQAYLNTGWSEDGENVPSPVDGSAKTVLQRVGTDVAAAREALAAEQARPRPRKQLVAGLTAVVEEHSTAPTSTTDTTSEV